MFQLEDKIGVVEGRSYARRIDGLDAREIHKPIIAAAAQPSKLGYSCAASVYRWSDKDSISLLRNARAFPTGGAVNGRWNVIARFTVRRGGLICEAHAEDEHWHPCALEPGDEGGEG